MNNTTFTNKSVESVQELNDRYADALVPLVIVLSTAALIGIIGNTIVLVVFSVSKEYKFTSFKIFVLCLALLDLLTCLTIIPAEIAKTRHYFRVRSVAPCQMQCFFNIFFVVSVALTLLTICADRFRKVYQPFKKQIGPGLALKLSVFVILLSAIMAVPASIFCGVFEVPKPNIYGTHTTVNLCTVRKKFKNSPLPKIYRLSLTISLSSISMVMIVMYVLIVRIVFRQSRVRNAMGNFNIEVDKPADDSEGTQDDIQAENEVPVNDDTNLETDPPRKEKAAPIYFIERVKNDKDKNNQVQSSSASLNSDLKQSQSSLSKQKSSVSSFRVKLRRQQCSVSPVCLPYKTLIWLILTLVFIVTYSLYFALLSLFVYKQYLVSPEEQLSFMFLFRLYFVNSIINPVIYALLDQRFRKSSKALFDTRMATPKGCHRKE